MISTEMTKTELPGHQEIKLKLSGRTTKELVDFQSKLTRPQYIGDAQAMIIGFHLAQELLGRHLTSEAAFEYE